MPIKNLTLGICLVFAGQALAQNQTYTVRPGDTVSGIANRYHITSKAIIRANGFADKDRLALGQKLIIPAAAKASAKPKSTAGGYVVRSGDNDWTIAKRVGTTTTALHRLNPNVRWDRLKIGSHLSVPGSTPKTSVVKAPAIKSRHAVIAKDSVVVRRGASRTAGIVVTAAKGTPVTVLDRQNEWYKLRLPKGTSGWVRGDLLANAPAKVAAKAKPVQSKAKVAAKKPSRKAVASRPTPRKSSSNSGMRLASLERGSTGLLDAAQSLRGVRYRYGGMSRSGTDCSGFTTQVFRTQGVKLPRTSRDQAKVGAPVKDLKKGDLVFFKTTRGNRISHVGIYVGDGKFIHASSGGGKVQVNSLKDGYYRKRFATARRVVSPKPTPAPKKQPAAPAATPEPAKSVENVATEPPTDHVAN